MKLTLIALFLISFNLVSVSSAQVFINYDIGVAKTAFQDFELSDNYHHGFSPSLSNIGFKYVKNETKLELRFSHLYDKLTPAIQEINYFETNILEFRSNKFQLRYLKNIKSVSDRISFFLGYEILTKFLRYELDQESGFLTRRSDETRTMYVNLSLIGGIKYTKEDFEIECSLGFGAIRYIKKTEYNDYSIDYGMGLFLFRLLQSDFSVSFWLNERIAVKPVYSFRYESENIYYGSKQFEHSVLVGGVFKLW